MSADKPTELNPVESNQVSLRYVKDQTVQHHFTPMSGRVLADTSSGEKPIKC
jgi:hypothetical protein